MKPANPDSALAARLADLARAGQTVTYGALARELGWPMSRLTSALEAMMEEDSRAGRPLRAAVCEGRLSGGMPAQGFFMKAIELGYDIGNASGFVADHRARLADSD